jgi:ribosomal protein S18 acetylase RimI-like enzyme
MNAPLDNVFWHALTGRQAQYACGAGAARRFAPGFSPILGFADAQRPAFDGLDAVCESGERFYCDAWPGDPPPGWRLEAEAPVCQMVWNGPSPSVPPSERTCARLGPGDAASMLQLAEATNPGPFGPRTHELGEYWGIFEDGHLVAMAGERAELPGLREISGVCTQPGYRGRGYAGDLVSLLVRRQLARGCVPFLHVMQSNAAARALYERMGFVQRRLSAVRILARLPS